MTPRLTSPLLSIDRTPTHVRILVAGLGQLIYFGCHTGYACRD